MNQRIINRKKSNEIIHQCTSNAIKCSGGNAESLSHKITKFWIAQYCWEFGFEFCTEVVLHNNQRCDVLIKDWAVILEILGTEDIKSFEKKQYPLPTIPVSDLITVHDLVKMLDELANTQGTASDYYIIHNMNNMDVVKKSGQRLTSIRQIAQ